MLSFCIERFLILRIWGELMRVDFDIFVILCVGNVYMCMGRSFESH